jgi:hypothetical protein
MFIGSLLKQFLADANLFELYIGFNFHVHTLILSFVALESFLILCCYLVVIAYMLQRDFIVSLHAYMLYLLYFETDHILK